MRPATLNGLPGMAIASKSGIEGAWAPETRADRVAAIYIVRNPDKPGTVSGKTGLPLY